MRSTVAIGLLFALVTTAGFGFSLRARLADAAVNALLAPVTVFLAFPGRG